MRRANALLAVGFALVLAGCGSSAPTHAPSTTAAPEQNVGDVVSQVPLSDVDPAVAADSAEAWQLTYVSHNAVTDSPQHVTASVYLPKGESPPGGFPVVALGRDVAGSGQDCATSGATGQAPTIDAVLQSGRIAVVPDYLGLSPATADKTSYHPFLDSATVGQNTIDAVRATRNLSAQASTSWVAMGSGRGGQAAWAANELADGYGAGLNLRGAVSIAPTADFEDIADAAAAGTLTTEQRLAYVAYVNALSKEYDDFHLDDYRRGSATQNWDLLLSCTPERTAVAEQLAPQDLQPVRPQAQARLHGYLRKTNLPQGPTSAPMLVDFNGGDPLIPAAWTGRALSRACAMGDAITIVAQPDGSPAADPIAALGWIADRFNGVPPPNDCPAYVAANPPPPAVSAPVVGPATAPAAAAPASSDAAKPTGLSLINGWLPIAIQTVALGVLLAAIGWRTRRWRLRWLPLAVGAGVLVAAVSYGFVQFQGWGQDPPLLMWGWIGLTGLAIAVAMLGWPSAPWWRRVVAVAAVPLAAVSAATALNASLGYLPTVQTAWERATGGQPSDWVDEAALADMVRNGVRPTRGTVVTVKIPSDASGFSHRDELVYLPPAWFASSPPPPLPAVMMVGAEMSHPDDWLQAGGAMRVLDEYAFQHRGVAPVAVFPDSSGSFANDTECVNGSRGNAADHLIKDVIPYVTRNFGLRSEASSWGVVGWSTGGTCALTLSVSHPETFAGFVDLDGQLGPNIGSKEQTVARLFGGDADAWAAFDPKSVVEAHGVYSGLSAWIGVSEHTPTTYYPASTVAPSADALATWNPSSEERAKNATLLCQLLSGHGIECSVSSYGGSHDFPSASNGLSDALPWLAGKLRTPGAAVEPLPGASS